MKLPYDPHHHCIGSGVCVCGHGRSDEWEKYKNIIIRTYNFRSGCWSKLGLGRKGGSGSKTIRKVINNLLGSGCACKYDLYTRLEVLHNQKLPMSLYMHMREGLFVVPFRLEFICLWH